MYEPHGRRLSVGFFDASVVRCRTPSRVPPTADDKSIAPSIPPRRGALQRRGLHRPGRDVLCAHGDSGLYAFLAESPSIHKRRGVDARRHADDVRGRSMGMTCCVRQRAAASGDRGSSKWHSSMRSGRRIVEPMQGRAPHPLAGLHEWLSCVVGNRVVATANGDVEALGKR